ncbi:MAG: hypothetical protein ACXACI_14390 [Candidatus Hodarchaeales archaeon]
MTARSTTRRLMRRGFIVAFPLLLAIVLIFGSLALLEDDESNQRTKEATGIDINESVAQMIILLAIAFAILFAAFILVVSGFMRSQR